uniref:medium-chain acyl-CoA ligase n=1 Tax=Saccoglossus kowalevskii TaxID=10224 RepID=A0ABM0MVV4_SACKO|nr:PREDICTED: uncharacterized protein LOC102804956 [Saccoglossus kowalevskii]
MAYNLRPREGLPPHECPDCSTDDSPSTGNLILQGSLVSELATPKQHGGLHKREPLMTPISTRSLKQPPETEARLSQIETRLDKLTALLEQSLHVQKQTPEVQVSGVQSNIHNDDGLYMPYRMMRAGKPSSMSSKPLHSSLQDQSRGLHAAASYDNTSPATKKKVLAGEYIDLATLQYPSHSSCGEHDDAIEAVLKGSELTFQPKRKKVQINSFTQWLAAFGVYKSILYSQHPQLCKALLIYRRTIQNCDVNFQWHSVYSYDIKFCRKLAETRDFSYDKLDHELSITTFTDPSAAKSLPTCHRCKQPDRSSERLSLFCEDTHLTGDTRGGQEEKPEHILRSGKGSLLAKVDLEDAFYQIPVRPADWELLGCSWDLDIDRSGQSKTYYFYSKVLPFGLRSSPSLFKTFAFFWTTTLLSRSENFKLDVPEYFNFAADVLDKWAEREKTGERNTSIPAFWWTNNNGDELKWSFQDLKSKSARTAKFLYNVCGIRKGDRVMVILHRVPEWWLLCLACQRIGAVLCPGSPQLTTSDIKYRLSAAKAMTIVTDEEHAVMVDQYGHKNLKHKILVSEEKGQRDGWLSFHNLYQNSDDDFEALLIGTFPGVKQRLGWIGKTAPGADIRIVDSNGVEQPNGTEGIIGVKVYPERPVGLFAGYLDGDHLNEKIFRGGYYLTGDRGIKDDEGYIRFVSRDDDVILSSGYRISPVEVENVLFQHPAVAESAVVSSPDVVRGEIVKAFVVLQKNYRTHNAEKLIKELQEHSKKITAPYKYPRKIEFLDELPKTTTNKIQRFALRNKEWSRSRTVN